MYGSRASNGVVIVTTKRAKTGQTSISANAFYGVQQIPGRGLPDMMNAREYAQFRKEHYEENNRTVPAEFQNPDQYGEGTDWYNLLTRTRPYPELQFIAECRQRKIQHHRRAGLF